MSVADPILPEFTPSVMPLEYEVRRDRRSSGVVGILVTALLAAGAFALLRTGQPLAWAVVVFAFLPVEIGMTLFLVWRESPNGPPLENSRAGSPDDYTDQTMIPVVLFLFGLFVGPLVTLAVVVLAGPFVLIIPAVALVSLAFRRWRGLGAGVLVGLAICVSIVLSLCGGIRL